MAIQRITFTEWTPDQPSIVENLSTAKNVIPSAVGFKPFPLALDYSLSASQDLNNAITGKFSGTNITFAGGTSKLFKLDSGTLALSDVTKSGGYSTTNRWNFTQFGNTIIAANGVNKLQAWTLGSSTAFADLAAAAPIAKYVTVVRDFVVAANLDTGTNSNKIQWSDINDEYDWTSGGASQSDFQIVADGGAVNGITGGEFGLILMERSIVRMTYIGSPFFFQFDTIARNLGCREGNSVANYGNVTYFLSNEGFYSCDGSTIKAIGSQKVDNWFYEYADPTQFESMSATVDPVLKIVLWNFKTLTSSTFGGARLLLIYNWQMDKWSYAETDVDYVSNTSSIATAGATLESLDSTYTLSAGSFVIGTRYTIQTVGTTNFVAIGASSNTVGVNFQATGVGSGTGKVTSLDLIPVTMDSQQYTGGSLLFAGLRDTKIITFSKTISNANSELVTGDIGSEYNSTVTLARPIVENGSASVAVASRNLLSASINYSSYVPASSENRVSLRSNGKYHRFSIKPTGTNWSNIVAIDVDIIPQGTR